MADDDNLTDDEFLTMPPQRTKNDLLHAVEIRSNKVS